MTYVKFETIEFYNQFCSDKIPDPLKKIHVIEFKELHCFKENQKSGLWILKIDEQIFRRVIGGSISILSERALKELNKVK